MPPSHAMGVEDIVDDQSSNVVAFKCDHRSYFYFYRTIITKELKEDKCVEILRKIMDLSL